MRGIGFFGLCVGMRGAVRAAESPAPAKAKAKAKGKRQSKNAAEESTSSPGSPWAVQRERRLQLPRSSCYRATWQFQRKSFLGFLLSKSTNLDEYRDRSRVHPDWATDP